MRDRFLKVPAGYAARWLSDAADCALVERWTSDSPEATVYHASSYVEFAREQNGYADLLWLTRAGNPVLGIPVYPAGAVHMRTGYSGVMFARGPRDAPLRRGVTALMALLDANACLGFEVLQCAQAPAYDDPAYLTSLEFLLASHRLHGPCLYSRVLDVERLTSGSGTSTHAKSLMTRLTAGPDTSSELLLEHGMAPYEAELRNQIRQAIRHGLRVTCALPSTEAEITNAYSEFTPLHRESWERTGMVPHPVEYWTGLARAVVAGGGRDMVVCARDGDGVPLAAVTCHLHGDRALYCAGASSERGLAARANPLCLHAAIQACRQLGVRHFELGRFDAQESSRKELAITRYKAQFGGGLVRIVGFRTQPSILAVVRRCARRLLGAQP
ncbi:MAG: GNAT family N-acetyltransferase [Solirubrobacteraceae bacterium]